MTGNDNINTDGTANTSTTGFGEYTDYSEYTETSGEGSTSPTCKHHLTGVAGYGTGVWRAAALGDPSYLIYCLDDEGGCVRTTP